LVDLIDSSKLVNMVGSMLSTTFSGVSYTAKNFEVVDFVYNSLQGWCTRKANDSPRFFSWFESAQKVFFYGDIVSLLWTGGAALWSVGILIKPLIVSKEAALIAAGGCLASGLGFLGIAYGTVWIANKIFKSNDQNEISFGQGSGKQLFYIMRIIINIALTYLSPNPLFILSATIEAYTFLELAKRKWVQVIQ
jgi:hypothetical protein